MEGQENIPDYLNWYLKSRGLTLEQIKQSIERFEPIHESPDVLKLREVIQTQKLLVSLIDVLFKKIEENNAAVKETKTEEIQSAKSHSNVEKENPSIQESKDEEKSPSEETSKFEFSDISWYKEFLDTNETKENTA